ncbi:MAG: LacI family DNA-binding transcriptional regulator [Ilumatobacteraceae bacterium]
MAEQITLDDVARLAGVSRATASRSLNGRPGVRADVRDRVLLAADRLGFRPNRAARNLASGRSSVIGLVIPTDEPRIDPYGAAITHAIGRATTARDLGLMLHLAADEPGDTVHHILRDGLIDGLLVSSVAIGRPWVDELFDTRLPTVLVGTHPTRSDIVGVDVENLESSATVVGHLIEQGCRRIGIITGPLERADARQRLAGWRLAHERAGLVVDEALIVRGDFGHESGAAAGQALLSLGVDGVFGSNDQMALGALWALTRAGRHVPADVAVAGFDGTSFVDFLDLTLTTMVQPFAAIATAAVDELLRRIEGAPPGDPLLLEPTFAIGGSSFRGPTRAPV